MKFTYDKPETETRECVAYIDGVGNLRCKADDDQDMVIYTGSGNCLPCFDLDVEFDPSEATHKFYRGDSITITF